MNQLTIYQFNQLTTNYHIPVTSDQRPATSDQRPETRDQRPQNSTDQYVPPISPSSVRIETVRPDWSVQVSTANTLELSGR